MKKRILSLFLTAALCVGMLPNAAWAVDETHEESGMPSDTYVIDDDTESRPAVQTEETLTASDEESDAENCSHSSVTTAEDGTVTCDTCHAQMVAVTDRGIYYADIADALNDATDDTFITLLADTSTKKNINIHNSDNIAAYGQETVYLDLAGHNLTCSGEFSIGKEPLAPYDDPNTSIVLSFEGSGIVDANINVKYSGDLTLLQWDGGTIKSVVVETGGGFGSPDFGTIEKLQLNASDTKRRRTIKLGGGSYGDIFNTTGEELTLSDLLLTSYIGHTTDGQLVKYSDTLANGDHIRDLTLSRCTTHIDDGNGSCIYCNATTNLSAASVTTTKGDITYYENFTDALAAAKHRDYTITLLQDIDLEHTYIDTDNIKEPITLDLNGKTLSGNSYNGVILVDTYNLTIRDSAGNGKIINTTDGYSAVRVQSGTLKVEAGSFGDVQIINSGKAKLSGGTFERLSVSTNTIGSLLEAGYACKTADGWADEAKTSAENVTVAQAPIQSVSLTSDAENNTVKYGEKAVKLNWACTYVGDNNVKYTLYQDNGDGFTISMERSYDTITLSSDLSAGEHKYRVVFTKDGYSKSAEITITVEPINITAATVTTSNFTYDGTEHTPDVTVKLGDKTLSADTDYDASVDKQTDAGSYELTITGKGNYTGTKDASWTIQPKTLTITDAIIGPKHYDGTTAATVESVTFDGLVEGESLALGTNFSATGVFDTPNAGTDKDVTVTVTLNDSVKNYTLGTNNSITLRNGYLQKNTEIGIDDMKLVIINGLSRTYEINIPDLPKLDAPMEYGGNCTYTLGDFHLGAGYEATAELDTTSSPKKLKLHVTSTGSDQNLNITLIPIYIETDNYIDSIYVMVNARNKTDPYPYGELILSPENITYGDTLDNITISGEMKEQFGFVPGTFSWVKGSEKPKAGEYEAEWLFTPTNEIAYNKVTGNVWIEVNKAKFTNVSAQQNGTLTYNGEPQSAAVSASGTGACGESATFWYGTSKDGDDFGTQVPAFTNAGKYTVYYQAFDEAGNHEVSTGTFTVTIDPKTVDTPTIELTGDQTYTGEEIKPTVTVKDGKTVIPDTEYEVIYTDNINAGTATVTLKNKDGGNYIVSGTTTFEISKAESAVTTAPTANALTYNGTEQALITAGEAAGGTMMYSLTKDGEYTATIPTGKDAKTYTVWYKVVGDSKHNDTAPQSVEVTVAKAAVTVKANDKSAYTGSTAPDLSNPLQDTDYTVSGLFGEDTLSGTITLAYDGTPDMTKTGETAIKITGTLENENYTVSYVDGKLTVSARSSGGHSSSSSSSSTISASKSDNGSVSIDKASASKGSTVTVTVKAEEGYKLDKLTITDAKGNTIEVTDKGDGKFSFVMPDGKVTVTPTFVADNGGQTESKSYNDVKTGDWYADAVQYVSDKGLMSGTGSDKFAPNDTTTRAMLMTVLARYAGEDTTGGATWYEKGMNWAKTNGVSDGTNPNANITREQLVTMLYRYAGSPAANGKLDDFTDSASVSNYAVNAMQWAVANGIVNGSNGKLNPQNNATRAEVAAILMRFCEMSK